MCMGMANGGKTRVDKVENFIRETNEWHRVAELNANEIIKLQVEVDQWKAEANKYQNLWCEDVQTARTEAIKEFAEKVKMAFYYEFGELIPSIMADKIDNLVKEMVGDDK